MRIHRKRNFWVAAAITAAVMLAVTAGVSASGLARDAHTTSAVPHIETSLPLASHATSPSISVDTSTSWIPTQTPTPRAESADPSPSDRLAVVPAPSSPTAPRHPAATPEQPSIDPDDDGDDDREVVRPDVRDDEDDESDHDHED